VPNDFGGLYFSTMNGGVSHLLLLRLTSSARQLAGGDWTKARAVGL